MRFGRSSLDPSYSRTGDFHTLESNISIHTFHCIHCDGEIAISFEEFIGLASKWESDHDVETVRTIKKFFRIGYVGKSQDGGWPSIAIRTCKQCNTQHLLYAGINETSNSVYKVTVQGIVEILD